MDEKEKIRKWIKVWEEAGPALDEIKRKELQAEDYYEKNLPLLKTMLHYAHEHREVRLTSGLVEQQRWFQKLRKKMVSLDLLKPE